MKRYLSPTEDISYDFSQLFSLYFVFNLYQLYIWSKKSFLEDGKHLVPPNYTEH